jgi:hypothetical protein
VFHDQDGLTAGDQIIVGGIACQHGNLMGSCFARVGTDPALGGWRRVSSVGSRWRRKSVPLMSRSESR